MLEEWEVHWFSTIETWCGGPCFELILEGLPARDPREQVSSVLRASAWADPSPPIRQVVSRHEHWILGPPHLDIPIGFRLHGKADHAVLATYPPQYQRYSGNDNACGVDSDERSKAPGTIRLIDGLVDVAIAMMERLRFERAIITDETEYPTDSATPGLYAYGWYARYSRMRGWKGTGDPLWMRLPLT